MYTVYADSTCIYNDVSPSQKNLILNPKLILEDNSAGSFEFTIPASNPASISIKRLTTDITIKRDGKEIWSGRVLDEGGDFYNNRKVYCEGELAFFNDSTQTPAEYHDLTVRQFLESLINVHNGQVGANRRFTVGAVTVVDSNDSLYRYTNYEKTIDCLKDKLLNRLGGHFVVRKQNGVRYLDYLQDYPNTSTQQIHFGKNLLDFAKSYSMADFVTAIIPRGAMINADEYSSESAYEVGEYCVYNNYIWRCKSAIQEDGENWNSSHWKKCQKYYEALTPYLTVEEVNNGSAIVAKKSLVDNYGVIIATVDWQDVTDSTNLLSKAQEYLNKVNYDNLELEVSAVDMRLLGAKYDAINLLDKVRVISKPHNLNQLFPVKRIEIPLDSPQETKFTMSTKDGLQDGLSNITSKTTSELKNNIDGVSNSTINSISDLQNSIDGISASTSEGLSNLQNNIDNVSSETSQSLNQLQNNIDEASNAATQKVNTLRDDFTAIISELEQSTNIRFTDVIQSAKDNAAQLVNSATKGFITVITNSNGTKELLITDELDYTKAHKVWRWNINGLGYSSDGGKTYKAAITMDGSIVADFITAGTLSGERVRGGVYEIGGAGLAKDGKILVKNAKGDILITLDKNGITFSNNETIPYSAVSNVPKSIKAKSNLYYMPTDNTWPAQPTARVTNSNEKLTDTWITKLPATPYGQNRVFTCEQLLYTDGTYGWTGVREYLTKSWTTQITKNTITTQFINALNITAKYLSTKDLIATGVSRIGGFFINQYYIQGFNNSNYNNSTIYCELGSWNPQWGQNGYAFSIWKRNDTSEQYKLKFGIRYDGSVVSESTVDVYPTDATYGLRVHGKLYGHGDLSLEGGIYTRYNVYADRNVSGSVVDGRTGVNANAGGIYAGKDIYAAGSIGCGGSKNRVVATKNYGYRSMNAYETATPYFGDIGEGALNEDGECIVYLDDIFSECIDTDCRYQVFLQKYGRGDIWVDSREQNYFIVKGTPKLKFGWELKALQKDYDGVRLDMPDDGMIKAIIEQYTEN